MFLQPGSFRHLLLEPYCIKQNHSQNRNHSEVSLCVMAVHGDSPRDSMNADAETKVSNLFIHMVINKFCVNV